MISRVKRRNKWFGLAFVFLFTIYGCMGMTWITGEVYMARDTWAFIAIPLAWFIFLVLLGGLWYCWGFVPFFRITSAPPAPQSPHGGIQ